MNGSILLVDDDVEDAALISQAFGRAGVGEFVRHVKSGEEALNYFMGLGVYADASRFPLPTLVVLDLRLPKMSGMEVLQWIRKQPDLRGVIVIILTGMQLDGAIQHAYLLGADAVMFKGTSQTQLDTKVQALKDRWLEVAHQAVCHAA